MKSPPVFNRGPRVLAKKFLRACRRFWPAPSQRQAHDSSAPANAASQWLDTHRLERMDATVDIFDDKRREFHLDRYRFAAKRVQGKQVLDCACGTGYGVRLLLDQGLAASVIGVDIDAQAIQYAWHYHNAGAAMFVCAPGDRLPFADASVDVITSFETIEHVPDDEALVQEFHRVLCPGGLLIVSTPNQWPLADTPYHVREYDRALFLSVLESRFQCLELYNQNSGSPTPLNHDQPRGIVKTTSANQDLAECFVAVCQRRTLGLGDSATRLTSMSSLFTE